MNTVAITILLLFLIILKPARGFYFTKNDDGFFLRRKRQSTNQEGPEKPTKPDYSETPDVIFVVQRSGMSDADFDYVRKFIGRGVQALHKFGPDVSQSRAGITIFTEMTQHHADFSNCCRNKGNFLFFIQQKMTLYNESVIRVLDDGTHNDLSPHGIDIKFAISAVRERYLAKGNAKIKPTLIVVILNFQTNYMSFRLINDAVSEIRGAEESGAYFSTIIIDAEANRQPRFDISKTEHPTRPNKGRASFNALQLSDTQKNQEKLSEFVSNREASKETSDESEYRKILERLTADSFEDNLLSGIAKLNNPREDAKKIYNDLTLLYAQAMSGRREHGLKLPSYEHLISPQVLGMLEMLLQRPMSWFGDAEVLAKCPDTKNFNERSIWSPDFFKHDQYKNGVNCQWLITVRVGMHVMLTFTTLDTEAEFDRIIIYDGDDVDSDQVVAYYSGDLTSGGRTVVANSTEEKMLISFETDGGHRGRGFYAVWSSEISFHKIEDASVVFLIDVSGSLHDANYTSVSRFIKLASKYFEIVDSPSTTDPFADFVKEGAMRKKKKQNKEAIPSKFGLVEFDDRSKILTDITRMTSRVDFYSMVESVNRSLGDTHIGKALDYVRLKQFLALLGEAAYAPKPPVVREQMKEIPRRVLFIFTDGHSVDDPKAAARRLCEWDIVPVLIAMGDVNLQAREDLTSFCGLAFYITTPVPEVMAQLIIHFNLTKPESTAEPTSVPPLPSKPPPPTRTTTTTTPRPTTQPAVYTGTYPTLPPTTKKPPVPDNFNYTGVAILLVAIGVLETIALAILIYYNSGIPPIFNKLPEQTQSMELSRKRLKSILKQDEDDINEEGHLSDGDIAVASKTNTFMEEPTANNSKLSVEEITKLQLRRSRYPKVVNSFFTKSAFVPDSSKFPEYENKEES